MESKNIHVGVTNDTADKEVVNVATNKKYLGRVLQTLHFPSKIHNKNESKQLRCDETENGSTLSTVISTNQTISVTENLNENQNNHSENNNNFNQNVNSNTKNISLKQKVQFPVYNNLRTVMKDMRAKQIEKKHEVTEKKEKSTHQKSKHNKHLKRSRSYEVQNQIIFVITWFCLLPFYYVTLIVVRTIRYWIGHLNVNESLFFMNTPAVKIIVSTIIGLMLLSLVAHRLAAFIVGFLLRVLLRKSLFHNNGQFDIHFGWISYRGFLDLNQIVIHDLMWRNPPAFQRTPFLLHCKALTISFDIKHILYDLICCSVVLNQNIKAIEFDEINIDSLEIYFERGNTILTENSLNAWAAVGAENKTSEKNIFQTIVKGIWQAVVNRTKKNYMFKLSNWRRNPLTSSDHNQANKVGSFWKSSSISSRHRKDNNSNMSVLNNDYVNNVQTYNDDENDHATAADNDDDDDNRNDGDMLLHDEDLAVLGLSNSTSSSAAAAAALPVPSLVATTNKTTIKTTTTSPSSTKPVINPSNTSPHQPPPLAPLPTVELNRLLIFNLIAHPLDLLSVSHIRRYDIDSCKSTVQVKIFHLTRYDITKPKPITLQSKIKRMTSSTRITTNTLSVASNPSNPSNDSTISAGGSGNDTHSHDDDDGQELYGKEEDDNHELQRIALPADEFGDKFGDAFAAVLVSQNPRSILITLIASIISKMMSNVSVGAAAGCSIK